MRSLANTSTESGHLTVTSQHQQLRGGGGDRNESSILKASNSVNISSVERRGAFARGPPPKWKTKDGGGIIASWKGSWQRTGGSRSTIMMKYQ